MSKKVKFVHLADLHLGGWREKSLTKLNFSTFQKAIEKIIEIKPEFALFAGDIFNNALPPIDLVEKVVREFMKLKEKNIPLFVIGGSHDYSNTGKSYISLLESTKLFIDVSKFKFVDKTKVELNLTKHKNVVISGILGRKNGLDKNIYSNLNSNVLSKDNFNIFMFHTTLNDFKPDFMRAVKTEVTKSYLPKGFDYYAGGHIHTHMVGDYSTGTLSYPGPLFPNNFSELKREIPCFNLCEFDFETRKTKIERVYLKTYKKEYLKLEVKEKNPFDIKLELESKIENLDLKNKIFLIEISGIVKGKISDIRLNEIVNLCYDKGALTVLKNTYKLTSSDLQISNIEVDENTKELEEDLIKKFLENEKNLVDSVKKLLNLDLVKQEGEKVSQYEQRVYEAIEKSL